MLHSFPQVRYMTNPEHTNELPDNQDPFPHTNHSPKEFTYYKESAITRRTWVNGYAQVPRQETGERKQPFIANSLNMSQSALTGM